MRAALEDNGPKETERPKELSINIQGKDGMYIHSSCVQQMSGKGTVGVGTKSVCGH